MMEDWREVEVIWQEGVLFSGYDRKGNSLTMSGEGNGFSPMELLLLGLAGCTGVDVAEILRKKRKDLTSFTIKVRGLRRNEIPRIFTHIEVEYVFRGQGLDTKAVEQAIELSEGKYCSVSLMLSESAQIRSSYRIEVS